jgi:hypothetical protein
MTRLRTAGPVSCINGRGSSATVLAVRLGGCDAYCDPAADARVILKRYFWLVRDILTHEINGRISNGRGAVRDSILDRFTNIRPAQISRVDGDRCAERFESFRAVGYDRRAHTAENRLEDESESGL